MPLISERDRTFIREKFAAELTAPVTVELFVRPEPAIFIPGRQPTTSKETRALLEEVADCSDRITLNVHDVTSEPETAEQAGIDRFPAFVLKGPSENRIRFFGMPSGYEFASLLEDLVTVSSGEANLAPETSEAIGALTDDVQIQVFVTPT